MKKLHSVTRTVTFSVLAEDASEAEQIAQESCPINVFPPGAVIDTRVYLTPNQSMDLKRRAINYND